MPILTQLLAGVGPVIIVVVIAAVLLFMNAVRVVQEYERGVIFRLGRLVGARGPGLFFLIPGVERMKKIDLRVITMEVPSQEALTRDNVTVIFPLPLDLLRGLIEFTRGGTG